MLAVAGKLAQPSPNLGGLAAFYLFPDLFLLGSSQPFVEIFRLLYRKILAGAFDLSFLFIALLSQYLFSPLVVKNR
jgi:hypothetical protein